MFECTARLRPPAAWSTWRRRTRPWTCTPPQAELDRWAEELLRRARRTVRGLDDARVVEAKTCVRPLPADGQSIVGRLPGAPGLYVAVTHSGVTLAAHLSQLIAAELTTGAPTAELAPYRPARFLATAPPPAGKLP